MCSAGLHKPKYLLRLGTYMLCGTQWWCSDYPSLSYFLGMNCFLVTGRLSYYLGWKVTLDYLKVIMSMEQCKVGSAQLPAGAKPHHLEMPQAHICIATCTAVQCYPVPP